jgi:LPS sulfotransferase NodH
MTTLPTEKTPHNPKFEDAVYDFPNPTPPRHYYMIASTPRAGGTYFSQSLWRTGIMGAPHEYFGFYGTFLQLVARLKPATLQSFLEDLVPRRTSANGVFGVKVHYDHLQFMLLSGVMSQFKNSKVIFIERQDHLAQAVSHARALQTSQWTSLHDARKSAPTYDANLIRWCVNHINLQRQGWRSFFEQHKVSPIRVDYDDFIAAPSRVIDEVVAHMDVPAAPVSSVALPEIDKQSDNLNVEWMARFKAETEQSGSGAV